ncbi:MAG: porin [Chitinophagaceae bacterium]|nr:porin [Chitinophagaceae bacterium]
MNKLITFLALFLCSCLIVAAQDTATTTPLLTWSGAAETYYSYDFNREVGNDYPAFVYSHHHHNELDINLAYIKAAFATTNLRANIAFGTGTYMNVNYASAPGVFRNTYEANTGIKLLRKRAVWLDAGVLPSHIGLEGALNTVNATLTRSILAENSPYYETGVRLSSTSNSGKWYLAALVLNGWQRVQRVPGSNATNAGTQVSFTPSGKLSVNYSTFVGSDFPDSVRRWRHFHNLYTAITASSRLTVFAGADYGLQQSKKNSDTWHPWYGAVLIARYKLTEKLAAAARTEYFSDRDSVIVNIGHPDGLAAVGGSLNVDYRINKYAIWRVESKMLSAPDAIFVTRKNPSRNDVTLTTSLTISF